MATAQPEARQLAWQDLEAGLLVRLGLGTFAGTGVCDPAAPVDLFQPTELDAHQWAAAASLAGLRYLLLEAKAADGFCLWPSDTTARSVAASPWRDGQGDVVAEVAAACHAQGIKLALSCSPAGCDARTYLTQWQELLTRYGEVVAVRLDEAALAKAGVAPAAVSTLVGRLQPAALRVGGPEARPAGDDHGRVPETWRNTDRWQGRVAWRPGEASLSLRDGATRRSMADLWAAWHHSVGRGCNLLLGVDVDQRGLLPEADAAALINLHRLLGRAYAEDLTAQGEALATGVAGQEARNAAPNAIDGDRRTRWQADGVPAGVQVSFGQPVTIDRAVVEEWLADGERVEAWRLTADGQVLATGDGLGHKRIIRFAPTAVRQVRVEVLRAAAPPAIRSVQLYRGSDPD